ncbi:MAG: Gfo/Idh/MocA family oxidoreductase [Phycisphaeraceae bacterium]|nr:Gfo/Idh/MocA family oxidoreductase [Phycisphaeraceae bacterium]
MKEVRLGVIGCGGIANHHMGYFPKIKGMKFVAAADPVADNTKSVAARHPGLATFDDGLKLIRSGLVDAVLIATPHYFHPLYAIAAFKQGLHVLTEKPIAVTALAAQKMIDESRKHKNLLFAAMFQMRTGAKWKKVKQIVDSGQLGPIRRVTWIATNWFRSQAYYDSGSWRATWAGEGGGVLLNQCPHNLDLLTWITGTPNLVIAQAKLGKTHRIEVEDEVNAYFEYPNGATGNFITTTGEAPGSDHFELAGDMGKLIVQEGAGHVQVIFNQLSANKFLNTTPEAWAKPPTEKVTIEVSGGGDHHIVMQNFINAILHGEKLIAPAHEGLAGLELANAMLMSGLTGKPVKIPTPRPAYEALLKKLIKTSTFKKATAKPTKSDMTKSFHK